MIKLVLGGIWACAITLAAVYFSVHMATAPVAVDPEAAKKNALEFVRGESVNIPIIGDGSVTGYFIGRISFMMNKEMLKGVDLPLTEMTTDELFSLLIGNKMIDIGHLTAFNIDAFREDIKKNMNERLGGEFVSAVLVEQLDYLSKDEVRASGSGEAKKPGKPVNIVKGDPVPTATE